MGPNLPFRVLAKTTIYVDSTCVIDSFSYPSPLSSILHLSHLLGAKLTGRAKLVLVPPRLLWCTSGVATPVPSVSTASSPGSRYRAFGFPPTILWLTLTCILPQGY